MPMVWGGHEDEIKVWSHAYLAEVGISAAVVIPVVFIYSLLKGFGSKGGVVPPIFVAVVQVMNITNCKHSDVCFAKKSV